MSNIRRQYTPHINPNDCWALVLSRVSNRNYNDIYNQMRGLRYADDTGFKNKYLDRVLSNYRYIPVYLPASKEKLVIRDILTMFYNKQVVIGSLNMEKGLPHLSYAHRGVDYTTSETDLSMNDPVIYIWVRQ